MRKFFIEDKDVKEKFITLQGNEFFHLKNVLRLKKGDEIQCSNNKDKKYFCIIKDIFEDKAILEIIEVLDVEAPKTKLTLFQGVPKGSKLDFITQKMSELGVFEIIPFENQYCVSKISENKMKRLERISLEASKQCGRPFHLKIGSCVSFKQMLEKLDKYDLVIFANETENCKVLCEIDLKEYENIAFIVGSEGGFSKQDISLLDKSNILSISLGDRILRTETASVVLASILQYKLGEI